MTARFGDELRRTVPDVPARDVRWAELWALERQLRLVTHSGLPTQLLVSSLRVDDADTSIDGSFSAHLERLVGRPAVATCPAPYLDAVMANDDGGVRTGELAPPPEVHDRVARYPWVRAALDPDGIPPSQFAALHPFRLNAHQHLQALESLRATVEVAP